MKVGVNFVQFSRFLGGLLVCFVFLEIECDFSVGCPIRVWFCEEAGSRPCGVLVHLKFL